MKTSFFKIYYLISLLGFITWIIANSLVIYSWVYYQNNPLTHIIAMVLFFVFGLISLGNYYLFSIFIKLRYLGCFISTIALLVALLAISGEYHRLFNEALPLFD